MRIDKFLKVSRVIKRRTVANEACDGGRVAINGRPAKAGADVKPGDVVEVSFAGNKMKFEVLSVAETVRKDDAKDMYRIITD
ncbi:MAG: RNA-binding S4 domain-containing protein [Clostridia bacterium]